MMIRFVAPVTLGLFLSANFVSAQTVAEQMQKAIYAQETTGNVDGAIQIYRQILNSGPSGQYAAQAQFHLAEALLRKGDLQGAAQEFQVLSQTYPQYKDLVASMAAQMRLGSQQEGGILQNGRLHDFLTDVEFPIPGGWSFQGDGPSSGDGNMAVVDSSSKIAVLVWMKPEVVMPSDIPSKLSQDMVEKQSQRSAGWKIRPESVQQRSLSGRSGVSSIADYIEDGKPMVEYDFWAYSGKTHIFFFGRAEPQQLSTLQNDVDTVANSALIP